MSEQQHLDTHTAVKKLMAAGLTEPQAEVIVFTQQQIIDDRSATRLQLAEVEAALRRDLAELEKEITEIRKDIEVLRAETKQAIAETKQAIAELGNKLTVRLGLMLTGTIGLLVALQQIFQQSSA